MTIGPGRKRRTGAKGRLKLPTEFLGDPLPEREAAMWAALSIDQRAKATQRMVALSKWLAPNSSIEAKTAAADAGVSVTRMYEMGKAWRQRKSLESLGAFAGAPKTRVSKYDAALRRAVRPVVDADPRGSVRKLALELEAASAIPPDEMPSHNTLRRYVEDELRAREQQSKAGDDLQLDCSACTLTPSDSTLVTLFAVMDRWTQVVLGAALGNVAESRRGYALAAQDALRRLEAGQFDRLPWVERASRAEAVIGQDESNWSGVAGELKAAGVAIPFEPSTRPNRYARYLRKLTGLRIGTVVVLPKYTDGSIDAGVLSPEKPVMPDHLARLSVEVDEHNARLIDAIETVNGKSPPADVLKFLKVLSTI